MTEEEIEQLWNKYNDEVKVELGYPHKSFSQDMFFKKLFKKCYADLLNQLTEKDKQIHDLKNDYEMLDNCNRIHENELKEKDKQIKDLQSKLEEYDLEMGLHRLHEMIEEGQRTDEKARKQAYIQGYKDANKWHFVKDELPLIGRPCVCIDFEHNIGIAYLREDNVWTTNGKNAFETVKLWQYIELPEPPKEIKE